MEKINVCSLMFDEVAWTKRSEKFPIPAINSSSDTKDNVTSLISQDSDFTTSVDKNHSILQSELNVIIKNWVDWTAAMKN